MKVHEAVFAELGLPDEDRPGLGVELANEEMGGLLAAKTTGVDEPPDEGAIVFKWAASAGLKDPSQLFAGEDVRHSVFRRVARYRLQGVLAQFSDDLQVVQEDRHPLELT